MCATSPASSISSSHRHTTTRRARASGERRRGAPAGCRWPDRVEVDPPSGGDSARPGLEPEPRRLLHAARHAARSELHAPAPLDTGKVATPPKPRTREWPFLAAPAAPAAASQIRGHTSTPCHGCKSVHEPAAAATRRRGAARVASGGAGAHLQDADDHRELVDPPSGGDSTRPGLEPGRAASCRCWLTRRQVSMARKKNADTGERRGLRR